MIHPILAQLNRINKRTKHDIICFPTHEGYQSTLDKTGNNFKMAWNPQIKRWDFHTRPLPPNHSLFIVENLNINLTLEADIILSQERVNQLPMCLEIKRISGLPLIHLEHTEPPPGLNPKQLEKVKRNRADVHVYITEYNRNSWGDPDGRVIPHGIDHSIFQGYTGVEAHGVSVVNLFPQRDVFCGWGIFQEISKELPIQLFGYNPGLSESINEPTVLASKLARSRFYLNTSILSPVPLSLLEAACCGLPVVSTAHQEVPKIFTHGKDAFLSNDPKDLIKYCKVLIEDTDLARKMGEEARKTVMTKFGIDAFIQNWNNLFNEVS